MKPLYSFLALSLTAGPLAAQGLTNDGSTITVSTGATLFVAGPLENKTGGTFSNAGTVEVGGDLTNAGTLTSTGLVRLTGTANQTLTPGGASLAQLEVANTGAAAQNVVSVPADLTITQQLTLTSGMVRTAAAATISLPNTASVSGEAPGRYVQGNLQVTRTGVNSATNFGNGATLDPGNNIGTVTVKRTAGLLLPNVSYGQNNAVPALQGIDRIWTITSSNNVNNAVAVTLSWLPENDHNLSSFAQAQAWRATSATTWAKAGAQAAATTTSTSRSFSFSTTVLGALTVSNAANPLPVELVDFTAERQDNDGLLRWATASEKNNDRFEVEASADGSTFRRIGQVQGHGTTAQRHDYRFLDQNLARYQASTVYYRLRQVDQDGTETLSPVRMVQVPGATPKLLAEAFPTPHYGGPLTLRVQAPAAGPLTLRVLEATGRVLWQETRTVQAGWHEQPLARAAELPAGLYLLSVQQAGQQQMVKLVRE
ncbi:T9SS type A sorting domain-containing protein [Hymenobacter psychrotolerans]|uniref:Por secretion system C-terminal sorting domain-containing protein n=1 Tax=Hymenobacter psychrotolerans DSM 18569 TaxID=1121959 RepID=A0A1M6QEJ7_9BACT|nr:T9SS type A sorting domain-containing protein [Hymenobacter psychrotolerans]SHK18672.1 Por secretion system C-terminal sorting domain-containing protein [Hymenobacter psychrotolerans DSM 18569]